VGYFCLGALEAVRILYSDLPWRQRLRYRTHSMPKPYSYDLRQKVIQAIKLDGLKKNEDN
jgi:hypothetical protein